VVKGEEVTAELADVEILRQYLDSASVHQEVQLGLFEAWLDG
jgi:hypothetical protein